MEQNFIARNEHVEFVKRMEDEHTRQNCRISDLEITVKQIGDLTTAVEKMAVNMEQMLTELTTQGKRLEVLESRDGEKWRNISSHIITAVVGAVVCYLLTHIGL